MSSPRWNALLGGTPPAPTVDLPAVSISGEASGSLVDGGLFTLTARDAPPRRVLLWIRDLENTQIGVVS